MSDVGVLRDRSARSTSLVYCFIDALLHLLSPSADPFDYYQVFQHVEDTSESKISMTDAFSISHFLSKLRILA